MTGFDQQGALRLWMAAVVATTCAACVEPGPDWIDGSPSTVAGGDGDPSAPPAAPPPADDGNQGGNQGGAGGSVDSGPDPYDSDPVCTSGTFWTGGDQGSRRMYPGRACIDCHQQDGPRYQIAGTVYPTAHEPNDCYGTLDALAGVFVEVLDADGASWSLPIGAAGNFTLADDAVAFPVSVKVVSGGSELAMATAVQAADGDCNRCHSQDGIDGAPGRILLP